MSYTELESGYQDLRQQSSQQQAAAGAAQPHVTVMGTAGVNVERPHQRPGFFVGHDGNYSSTEKVDKRQQDNPVVLVMGNSFEKLMSAAGGRDDWSRYVTNGQDKQGNSHKRLQCQLCKKYQQQCLTCGAYGGTDVGGSSMLHVSSTPNLGDATLPNALPLDLRSSSFSYGKNTRGCMF